MVLDSMNYFVIQTYCSHCCEYNGLAGEGGRRRRCTQNIQTQTHILTQTHTTHTHTCTQDCVRRGVRSDAQLSCTETRFQKCSQIGKNGSEHPMLSISMAYNMISCKKVERNTHKLKIADFTM